MPVDVLMYQPIPGKPRILKQVTHCALAKGVPPSLPAMLVCIMDHMATLAERG